jgi:MFS family permease
MILFGLFLAAAIATLAVVLYFFVIGLADGSVSSFNIVLWLALVGIAVAVPLGGWRLDIAGRRKTATALLAVVAAPAIAYALFVLLIVITQPRWN